MSIATFHAPLAWTPSGWRTHQRLALDTRGRFAAADTDGPAPSLSGGPVLPGLPNLHSHAFQRALLGRVERAGPGEDSFWSWREAMYQVAARFDPDVLRAVAAQLYAEMLEAGYTRVCEFHYLHHAPDGRPYAEPAAMSLALVEAAREAGIGLTLLPVLYQRGGFDGRALGERQRRFAHDHDAFLALLARLRREEARDPDLRVGLAFHSLRAVDEAAMRGVLAALPDPSMPVHLHIAEQVGEVADCLAVHGQRPVRWLLDRFAIDARWTLVHATHLDDGELAGIAASGATVALCPATEANLGDGLFPLRAYLAAGGAFGIGSDSQVSVDPVEELRWLEHGARLGSLKRNRAALAPGASSGETLLAGALAGGAAACGRAPSALAAGGEGDLVVLHGDDPAFAGVAEDGLVDAWLFGRRRPGVREAWRGGRALVLEGRHVRGEAIGRAFRAAMARIAG
jgi:formimidoylglutamate deiminase